ncbi:rCG60232 [Rattus norvegicus]|uniref:RCG60232 n=1 Tax=Rattus norvegicus TaxID=10116 RepID=A6HTD0_RAT|nr:rCG60232 [Rattus norvegicus]
MLRVKSGKVMGPPVSGGNSKQSFPMKQGVLTHSRTPCC